MQSIFFLLIQHDFHESSETQKVSGGPPNCLSLYDKLSEKRKDRQAGIPPSSRRSCQFGPLAEPDPLELT